MAETYYCLQQKNPIKIHSESSQQPLQLSLCQIVSIQGPKGPYKAIRGGVRISQRQFCPGRTLDISALQRIGHRFLGPGQPCKGQSQSLPFQSFRKDQSTGLSSSSSPCKSRKWRQLKIASLTSYIGGKL